MSFERDQRVGVLSLIRARRIQMTGQGARPAGRVYSNQRFVISRCVATLHADAAHFLTLAD